MKKYELIPTDTIALPNDVTVTRIRALIAIPTIGVKVGDLGGYIQSESNLSHYGNAWVHQDAEVFGNAVVFGDANVSGRARVYENADVFGNAVVSGDAMVSGDYQLSNWE